MNYTLDDMKKAFDAGYDLALFEEGVVKHGQKFPNFIESAFPEEEAFLWNLTWREVGDDGPQNHTIIALNQGEALNLAMRFFSEKGIQPYFFHVTKKEAQNPMAWDCDLSPSDKCVYAEDDSMKDDCLFCHLPYERK